MRIIDVEPNSEQWFIERRGSITGSSSKDILPTSDGYTKDELIAALEEQGATFNPKDTIAKLQLLLDDDTRYILYKKSEKKVGFWRAVAERLFPPLGPDEYEDARDRGHRLESEAIAHFERETGKKAVPIGICVSDDSEWIRVSPDAAVWETIDKVDIVTEAVETKNFEDAHHAEAVITGKVPKEIWPQVLQYFVVIETLQKVHLVFHTDRTNNPKLKYLCITVNREDVQDRINEQKNKELRAIRLIDEIVEEYAF